MFDNIFAAIEKWMRELLSGMVESNLSTMFTAVNQQTSEIAAQVGQTPQGWNSSIFSMIRNISDSVVIPIAGIIITLILCYELISMLTERNNLHDVDTWMFFKYFVKMWIAVYLVSHTFDIAMAVFDIGQSVVNSSSGIIRGNTAIDISSLSMQMQAAMATMAIGELVTLALETLVVSWCLKILSVVITVIMYGRMIEIYLYTSLAPIPFATMSNREWGHVGTNYFRGLFALAFQAFLMMVCVAIYAALIGSIRVSSDIHSALFGTMAYTVILCFSLLKTGSLSKQIFGSPGLTTSIRRSAYPSRARGTIRWKWAKTRWVISCALPMRWQASKGHYRRWNADWKPWNCSWRRQRKKPNAFCAGSRIG